MANLTSDIRLAVDSGAVAIGINSVMDSIATGKAKLVIASSKNKPGELSDIEHVAKLADVKVIVFDGDSIQLGTVCGKPYSVSAISILDQGDSNILNETY